MTHILNTFETMFNLGIALHKAYLEARKHKRNTHNQLYFEANLEFEETKLRKELENYTYNLSPSICFINEMPVKREIIAANFRDRVAHHLLYNWIYPLFDKQFIHDSYSCRIGKGTLFGINRAKSFIQSESRNFSRECYALRLDISGFFMAINRDILYKLTMEGIEKVNWRGIPDRALANFLIKKFIYNDPLETAIFRSPPSAWETLPRNKTLRGSPKNCGLPIGNLTSQLFGNIYLNPLDHYVKRVLKIHCYGRYVDDMILVHHDKNVLIESIEKIRLFLKNELQLTLHPKKIYLQSVQNGFYFLGAFILPYRTYPSRRIMGNLRHRLYHPADDPKLQDNRISSYKGLLNHFDCHKIRARKNLL